MKLSNFDVYMYLIKISKIIEFFYFFKIFMHKLDDITFNFIDFNSYGLFMKLVCYSYV